MLKNIDTCNDFRVLVQMSN